MLFPLVLCGLVISARAAYDPALSLTALNYATATYCEESSVESWTCGPACKTLPGVSSVALVSDFLEGTFGFVAYNNQTDTIAIAFRGSFNFINWVEDADYTQIDFPGHPGAKVHEGFYNAYQTLGYQVDDALKTMVGQHPTARVIVTGHSLGGAMATFAALEIRPLISQKIEFYSFGCPRVGNQAFSDHLASVYPDYYRVVHTNDIVPHLPMTSMGFNHAGYEVWYDSDDDRTAFKVCPYTVGQPEDESCSDSYWVYDPTAHQDYLGVDVTGQCFNNELI